MNRSSFSRMNFERSIQKNRRVEEKFSDADDDSWMEFDGAHPGVIWSSVMEYVEGSRKKKISRIEKQMRIIIVMFAMIGGGKGRWKKQKAAYGFRSYDDQKRCDERVENRRWSIMMIFVFVLSSRFLLSSHASSSCSFFFLFWSSLFLPLTSFSFSWFLMLYSLRLLLRMIIGSDDSRVLYMCLPRVENDNQGNRQTAGGRNDKKKRNVWINVGKEGLKIAV